MAAVDVGARDNPPVNDDLDDLFNYEVDNELFKDVDTNMDVAPKKDVLPNPSRGDLDGQLGLEEEVKVTKKRAPIPKLDEDRLLSQAGIPKLRKITKERLRFRGKGHEYSDVARMLNHYQLWLDDLYPRAKFADGLAMIEKLGHTKRMQVMRKEWISEGKASQEPRAVDVDVGSPIPEAQQPRPAQDAPHLSSSSQTSEGEEGQIPANDLSKADESLFISDDDTASKGHAEDDLDAILAEEDARQDVTQSGASKVGDGAKVTQNDFADEEEAMAGLDDFW